MKKYFGGAKVDEGNYYNIDTGGVVHFDGVDMLSGKETDRYLKVSGWFLGMMVPVATLLYVLLMPIVGLTIVVALLGYRIILFLIGASDIVSSHGKAV